MRANGVLELFLDNLKESMSVKIITGFPIVQEDVVHPDVDGIAGSLVLAEALAQIGCKVEVLAEPYCLSVLKELALHTHISSASIKNVGYLPSIKGDLAIFVEKPGANPLGVYHNAHGEDISSFCFHVEKYMKNFDLKASIGDLGNEVGFGVVYQEIKPYVKYGARCLCRCKAGIIASSKADFLITSTTSNIGSYVLAAAISITKNGVFLHDAHREELFTMKAIKLGAVDAFASSNFSVDGLDVRTCKTFVSQLSKICKSNLR